MIQPTSGSRIYLASGITYMRKGDARPVGVGESDVEQRALVGDVFVFRGRRGDQIKVLWFSGDGINLTLIVWSEAVLFGRVLRMERCCLSVVGLIIFLSLLDR